MVGVNGGVRTLSAMFHFCQLLKKGSPGGTATRRRSGRQSRARNGPRGKVDYCSSRDLRVGLPAAAERLVDSNQVVDYLLVTLRQRVLRRVERSLRLKHVEIGGIAFLVAIECK